MMWLSGNTKEQENDEWRIENAGAMVFSLYSLFTILYSHRTMKKLLFLFFLLYTFFLYVAPLAHAAGTVTFHIRYQNDMVFEGPWALGDPTPLTIQDKLGVGHAATSTSALAVLLDVDKAKDSFAVSDLAYFDSFQSFLVNCITIAKSNTNACFNWQYAVNGVLPSVGADRYLLKPGDDVFFFFGTPHRVILSKDSFLRGESFVAAAQNYLYQTNEWEALPGVMLGITKSNPADPFTPLIIATSTVDIGGKASFILHDKGTYGVGIAEDFYFPLFNLTVVLSQVITGGGSVASPPILHRDADVQKAIQFFVSYQNPDGSFGNAPLFSDWTAIAFGAYSGTNSAKEGLSKYLLSDPSPGGLLTDYERRAMALMALSINPYDGTATNYIQKIFERFDGTQFGSPDLVNDDIFALFPLLNAGFTERDPAISRTIAFVLSKQEKDGSWVGGVDMTSAAAQALAEVPSGKGVPAALERAKVYLKTKQDPEGGFDHNAFSTSWAMQAIKAFEEDGASWQRNGNTPGDYLYSLQGEDGGVTIERDTAARLWATAYAMPAVLQKPWSKILGIFTRPSQPSDRKNGGDQNVPPSAHENNSDTVFFSDRYILASKVRLQGEGMEEIEASLSIPQGTRGKNENGAWSGELFLRIATSTQAIATYLQGAAEQIPNPQGFLEVDAGKGVRLTFFDKPLTLVIPVFAKEGAPLDVYTRSEGEDAFHFLQTCVSSHHRCEIHTIHLSQFVALDAGAKIGKSSAVPSAPAHVDQKEATNEGALHALTPVSQEKIISKRIGKKQSPVSLVPLAINETLPRIDKFFPSEVQGHATSSPFLSPNKKNLALADEAKAIFPFALAATIILGAYLLRKVFP